jgi:hypothetical protein
MLYEIAHILPVIPVPAIFVAARQKRSNGNYERNCDVGKTIFRNRYILFHTEFYPRRVSSQDSVIAALSMDAYDRKALTTNSFSIYLLKGGIIKLSVVLGMLITPFFALASVTLEVCATVQRFDDGSMLITDAGANITSWRSKIIEVDSRGSLIWAYIPGNLYFAHSAQKLSNGNILISNTGVGAVIEINQDGTVVWSYATGLNYPNDADRLDNGNTLITDRDNDQVIEINPAGTIVWSYNLLNGPHNADRLDNGNTIVCNSGDDSVVEVDSLGNIVWSYSTGIDWPRDADRLDNGNTLITDSQNRRVIEVTTGGSIVWSHSITQLPYEADRLENGNTIITTVQMGQGQVLIVDQTGTLVWQYPRTVPTIIDTCFVYNPASGCSLYAHTHRPADATSSNRFPGVILIPGGNGYGAQYDDSNLADDIADDGFIVVHFDPDGRGNSTNGGMYTTEDYCGYIQQDGLWEIAKYLKSCPYVDTLSIGMFSHSYGITMAAGELSRHTDDPYIKFLLDWEGPSDRYQTCQDSGGHVPVPVDSQDFWIEREAALFMKSANVYYLRHQTAIDHNSDIVDNRHAIALVDSATGIQYGGSGMCPWTRVNDSLMNPSNTVYTVTNPPLWVAESLEQWKDVRNLLYLHELALKEPNLAVEEYRADRDADFRLFTDGIQKGTHSHVILTTTTSCYVILKAFDVTGRLAQDIYRGSLQSGEHRFSLKTLPNGVYFVLAVTKNFSIKRKTVILN